VVLSDQSAAVPSSKVQPLVDLLKAPLNPDVQAPGQSHGQSRASDIPVSML